MAPLTALTKINPKKFKQHWTAEHSKAFQAIRAMICQEVLLRYPDPNKKFKIQTDASKLQLGAVIYQDNFPIAFFSRKLNPAQQRYPASDKEALCIFEVLHEYRDILYGCEIEIDTDHKNLVQRDLKSPRLLHWRLMIEEFAPTTIRYIKGPDNVVADQLSRLPLVATEEKQEQNESNFFESFLFYPEEVDSFPLGFDKIKEAQQNDPVLLALQQNGSYTEQDFNGTELVCREIDGQQRIVLTDELVDQAITWYHFVLGHVGTTRLYSLLKTFVYHPQLKAKIDEYVATCDSCQRNKNQGPGYGHLPPRQDVSQPWEEIAVDSIGPWAVEIPSFGRIVFKALTVIDTCTTLTELVRLENGTAAHTAYKLEQCWFSRYPRPLRVVHDPGTEFVGAPFQLALQAMDIQAVPTTVKNPQANAICERMHKTIGDQLRNYVRVQPPSNIETALEIIDAILAASQRALRACVHRTLGISPGALVFHRDMLLPIPVIADYNLIRERRQAVIDENNRRQNLRRHFKDYQAGDLVLVKTYEPATMQERALGPFKVDQVHVNGTITIERANGVLERINIRRVCPY